MTQSMRELALQEIDVQPDATRIADDVKLPPVASAMALIAAELEEVEVRLGELLHSTFAIIPRIGGHLTFAGGKRFRPMVTLLAAQAVRYRSDWRITVAAAAELLHTATLLHDDVIDEGEFRRGRPAARLRYGNGLAVLTGDYCYARALQAVAQLGNPRAIQTMADAVVRMAEGEVAQLHVAGECDLDRERYYMVIDRKTAALISWCSSVAELVEPRAAAAWPATGARSATRFRSPTTSSTTASTSTSRARPAVRICARARPPCR